MGASGVNNCEYDVQPQHLRSRGFIGQYGPSRWFCANPVVPGLALDGRELCGHHFNIEFYAAVTTMMELMG